MLIRGSAGSFKCKIRWLHISLDLHNHAHNEVASVWVFLGGAGAQAYQTYIYCLSVCKELDFFVAKLLRKSRK